VLSELRKAGRCDPGVAEWASLVSSEEIYISVLSIGELRKGIENLRRRNAPSAEALEVWLNSLVTSYADRVLPINHGIADLWGRLNVPKPLPVVDGLLAATARVHDLTVVTRNLRDLERTGVPCLDPFSTPPRGS
jgi:toxin FitB